ncbi:PAS domain S-box protein [Oscillatoriales cyanobacterium LEGE 11467]|uniref:histidine kinase n=2 Tax=Zarconia TaxID=2992130 RepID=A0A928VZW5_9CYAN|nr:PAS domain S-box protein [Zarconia navalis LEGE 11467]
MEWYEQIVSPGYDRAGQISGTIAVAEVVTPNTQIEEQLRESQQLLQLVIDNIPQLIFWKDRHSVFQGCNLSAARIAGCKSPEEIIGKTDYDMPWTPEEADWYRDFDRRVMDSGQPRLHIIETQQQADGKHAWLDTNKIPLRDANGDVVGIVVTVEDITERKQAEKTLQQLNEELEKRVEARTEKLKQMVVQLERESHDRHQIEEKLRASEARLHRLADNIPGAIYEFQLDPDGRMCFPYVSSGFRDVFDVEPEPLRQDAAPAFKCVHPQDLRGLQAKIAHSTQTLENWTYEWRTLAPSGHYQWWKGIAKPERQPGGSIVWYGCIVNITDRKYTEAQLAAQQQRVSWLVEQSPLAIIEWSQRFEVQAWNRAAELMFGYSRDEALGRTGVELIVPESGKAAVTTVMEQLLNQTGGNYIVNENVTKDGDDIVCEWHNQRLVDAQGQTVGVFSMVLDITERCQIEEKLRASEARLQRLADNIPGAIHEFCIEPNGHHSFPYISSGARDVLELELEVLMQDATPAFDRVHPEDAPRFQVEIDRSVRTLENLESEFRYITPSGQKWLRVMFRPERQAGGEVICYGCTIDVTDRKRVEAEVAKLSLVASQTDSAVVITDKHGLTEWVNDSFVRISGYTFKEVQGKKPGSLLQGPLTSLETVDRIRETIRAQKPFQGEILNYDKQGRSYWLWLSINPVFDSNGELSQFIAIESDINDRKQYELQLKQQTEELEKTLSELKRTQVQLVQSEKMSSLGQLVAGIAHEINNPVNFIYGNLTYVNEYAEDLLAIIKVYQTHYPDPPPEVREDLDRDEVEFLQADLTKLLKSMRVGADRIREIVLSLRTFSRLDEADVKEVDIHEGIESTLTILQSRLKAHSVRIAGTEYYRGEISVIKDYGKLPMVECYSGPLNQVFMNIIANAIDAMEERDRTRTPAEIQQNPSTIRIATVADDASGRVTIRIVDNGPGIPQEIQSRIFDPFFTTKDIGKGTGLGMSISYQIVTEKHQGSLECISQLGRGTEFAIEIPVRSKSENEG